MPQVEVKFDVDANGILNVSAKDLGTGKEQTVRIEQSSGLNEAEIERMRKDADAHASEDKHKRDLAEMKNKGESMAFQLEKLMKEHKDKLTDADRSPLEAAIKKVKETNNSDDLDAIKSAVDELEQASHAFSKSLYSRVQPGAGPAGAGGPTGAADGAAGTQAGSRPGGEDEAIDAEFEVKE